MRTCPHSIMVLPINSCCHLCVVLIAPVVSTGDEVRPITDSEAVSFFHDLLKVIILPYLYHPCIAIMLFMLLMLPHVIKLKTNHYNNSIMTVRTAIFRDWSIFTPKESATATLNQTTSWCINQAPSEYQTSDVLRNLI